jgi:hypothetical protein
LLDRQGHIDPEVREDFAGDSVGVFHTGRGDRQDSRLPETT